MKANERFLDALKYMNSTMKNDNSLGHQWRYCNVTSKKVNGFENKRKKGKYLTNCVDGVQDGLRIAGIPSSALAWYGGEERIVFLNDNARREVKKYFDIIETGGKTPKQLFDARLLCDGDILLGYHGMNHTNAFFGGTNPKSFDSGHAYASGSGEGARFKKWIGNLSHKNTKVFYILRLKDRARYRVQCGAFHSETAMNEFRALILKKGIWTEPFEEDGMFKLQAGMFDGKTNANLTVAALSAKGIGAFVKEVG